MDIFELGADALVNPVNCFGVSGAGLALEFKRRFPQNDLAVQDAARAGLFARFGAIYVHSRVEGPPHWIINLPTKDHWREKASLMLIEEGLYNLMEAVRRHAISSVAIPALGCGLGCLEWSEVEPLIELYAGDLRKRGIRVWVIPPRKKSIMIADDGG